MKGKYGVPMNIYHTRVPYQGMLRKGVILSRQAKIRLKWMDYYHAHAKNARLTCRYFGVSPTTFYKWFRRYNQNELSTLENRSCIPHNKRRSTITHETRCRVVALRKHYPGWSKYKLGVLLRGEGYTISDSSIGRILKRRGLHQRVRRHHKTSHRVQRMRVPKDLVRKKPGHLVQVDVKYLVCTGNTFYQFTAIDVVTRLRYSRIYSSRGSVCGKRFLERMLDYYPFPVQAIQTDNGSEFLKVFDETCRERKIPHYFSYPNSPKQNAYVERVIRSDSYEYWYQGNMVDDLGMMRVYEKEWNHTYNRIRPHQALGYLTPWQYYQMLVSGGDGGDTM